MSKSEGPRLMLEFKAEIVGGIADGASRGSVNRVRPRIGCKRLETMGHLAMELELQCVVVRGARVGYEEQRNKDWDNN